MLPIPWVDRVHADAVAQQRATGLAARRIDRDDRDVDGVFLVQPDAADQLIGQRRLACAARARDAQRRHVQALGSLQQLAAQLGRCLVVLQRRDQLRQRAVTVHDVAALQRRQRRRRILRQVDVALLHHPLDHAGKAHALAVLRAEDARHAIVVQFRDLGWHDDAAATTEHLDVGTAALAQQVDHVLEVLDVAALVAGDRDALHVFRQGSGDHLVDGTVMSEVHDLDAMRLQDAAHDVDGSIVAVEQRSGRHEAHLVGRPRRRVGGEGLGGSQIVHGCP